MKQNKTTMTLLLISVLSNAILLFKMKNRSNRVNTLKYECKKLEDVEPFVTIMHNQYVFSSLNGILNNPNGRNDPESIAQRARDAQMQSAMRVCQNVLYVPDDNFILNGRRMSYNNPEIPEINRPYARIIKYLQESGTNYLSNSTEWAFKLEQKLQSSNHRVDPPRYNAR